MIKERILLLMNAQGMNPTQFADEIEVQRSSISHILSGRNNPSLDIVTKILKRFKEVDSNWLILGQGSLVSSKNEINIDKSPSLFDEEEILQKIENSSNNEYILEIEERIKDLESIIKVSEKKDITHNIIQGIDQETKHIVNTREVKKIIIFYNDNTFEELIKS